MTIYRVNLGWSVGPLVLLLYMFWGKWHCCQCACKMTQFPYQWTPVANHFIISKVVLNWAKLVGWVYVFDTIPAFCCHICYSMGFESGEFTVILGIRITVLLLVYLEKCIFKITYL